MKIKKHQKMVYSLYTKCMKLKNPCEEYTQNRQRSRHLSDGKNSYQSYQSILNNQIYGNFLFNTHRILGIVNCYRKPLPYEISFAQYSNF